MQDDPRSLNNIPIIGTKKDPFEELAKATGMTSFIVIGEVIDANNNRAYSQFIPYKADAMMQLGYLEYGKILLSAHITSDMRSEAVKYDQPDEPE